LLNLLEQKWEESDLDMSNLSTDDKKQVWNSRALFLGKHLREGPLRAFSSCYKSQALLEFRSAPGAGKRGTDWGYQEVIRAVEKMVYEGKGRVKFYKDRLRNVVQKHDVGSYNRTYKACSFNVPDEVMSLEQKWDGWINGLKPDMQLAVKKEFYLQEQRGEYPLEDAMMFATGQDSNFGLRTYQGNPFAPLRVGGATEDTPWAANGGRGRGRGGFGGGRGGQQGGFGGGRGGFGGGRGAFGGQQGGFDGQQGLGGDFGGDDRGFARGFDNRGFGNEAGALPGFGQGFGANGGQYRGGQPPPPGAPHGQGMPINRRA
jgi:hypothetical protein